MHRYISMYQLVAEKFGLTLACTDFPLPHTHTLNTQHPSPNRYISMYQLIAEEFSREDLVVKARLRWGMIGGLLAGAACMCVLAIWS